MISAHHPPVFPAAPRAGRRRGAARAIRIAGALLALSAGAGLGAEEGASGAPAAVPGGEALPASADLLYETTARFQFGGLPLTLHVRTRTRWKVSAGHYEAHLHMDKAAIAFDQDSWGTFAGDTALRPERYEETRPFHKPESAQIDWANQRIRFGENPPVPGPPAGAQDRLSLQFDLARQRQIDPARFVPGRELAIDLIGPRDVDPWKFRVEGEDVVQTGGGDMRAVHCAARRRVHDVEETMDVWLGADVHWLPVRIRMVDRKGAVIDSTLQQATLP